MRRGILSLTGDFLNDSFGLDARMWRTLGRMAMAPGAVPRDYANGRRSQFTPPVRLFIGISFLFFSILALTDTLFFAVELKKHDDSAGAVVALDARLPAQTDNEQEAAIVRECGLSATGRFFVREQDVVIEKERFRECRDLLMEVASSDIAAVADAARTAGDEKALADAKAASGFVDRIVAGLSSAIEDPAAFNAKVNDWLPRVMLGMTPVLALLLALFLRGRNALIYDHIILSFYTHAVGFVIVGIAAIAVHFGVRGVLPFATGALALYFLLALKRTYGRGWVKTLYTATFVGLLYSTILTAIVTSITASLMFRAA